MKIDILPITALIIIKKSWCTHLTHYNCEYLPQTTFRFYLIAFQLNIDFLSAILRLLPQIHLALLKDRFLKKMLLKRAKTHWLFYSNWKQFQVFKTARFEFMVTVHYYSLWAKCTQLWPLKREIAQTSIRLTGSTIRLTANFPLWFTGLWSNQGYRWL